MPAPTKGARLGGSPAHERMILANLATELFRQSNPEGAPQTERILKSIAVGRMGTPEDVARTAMFFLSPDNGFITGQVLYVCGGTTLGLAPV